MATSLPALPKEHHFVKNLLFGVPFQCHMLHRRTLMLSDGELSFFLERPAFITLAVITLLIILLPIVRGLLSGASGTNAQ